MLLRHFMKWTMQFRQGGQMVLQITLRVGVGKTWELLILQTVWFGILECVSNNGSNRRELRIVFGKWKVLTFYMAGVQWQNSLMVMWPMVKVVSLKPKAVC